tara:strand:+ start:583 stop:909 length:327 start_codon:yes stop_codon:yes gene_type:complete
MSNYTISMSILFTMCVIAPFIIDRLATSAQLRWSNYSIDYDAALYEDDYRQACMEDVMWDAWMVKLSNQEILEEANQEWKLYDEARQHAICDWCKQSPCAIDCDDIPF